jgi:hypothetical protein
MKSFGQKKMVRKMKFISDQEGIMNRYLREQGNWDSHLKNTKQFILNGFTDKKINSIAVLGSGWLLDFPLKEMSKRFKKILLVDVYHPAQIRKKAESFKNVTLFETDLSGGGIQFCWDLRKKKDEHFSKYILDEFIPSKPELPYKVDAYISLNLLNQLDILLIDFLKKNNNRIVDVEVLRFRKIIQNFHIHWISKNPACLITDFEEINQDDDKNPVSNPLIHINLPQAIRSEEWNWDFDLSKTYHEGIETRMKVKAIEW